MTRPQATPAPSAPVALLSPLQRTPSLRPRTSLRPLVLAVWQPTWDDDDNEVNDGASDEDSDVGGTEETKDDDSPIVDKTAVADRDVNAHTAEDVNPNGSDSPPLLSLPPSPTPVLVDTPAAPHHHVTFADIRVPPGDGDPMAALNRGISAHLSELDRQQRAIGDKYDVFRALLVVAQASFDAPAINLRIRSAIGAHTAPFSELISQAESAIDRKYEEISALHVASKSTISSAMTLLDAPALAQRALAAVNDVIRTATAPDGLLDRRIGKSIALAVDPDGLLEQRIGAFIASAVSSAVAFTMDENFVLYRTCVLDERHADEANLHAARKSAETDFQDAIAIITSDSIDTLNAVLRSAAADFAAKRDSVVNAITHARRGLVHTTTVPGRGSVDTTPVMAPPPPPRTSLETLADNATPTGSTKNVWADIQARRLSTPSTSPADHPDVTPPGKTPPPPDTTPPNDTP